MPSASADLEAVREFNRFYTRWVGALDGGFLETGHSLPEARVLFELGRGDAAAVADLRESLDLDPGYLSRLLARLEQEGLVARERSADDGRRQFARLTRSGRAAFRQLDRRSAARIGGELEADRPVVVHIKTVKGKGFAPAEEGGLEGMEKWHAAKPASIVDRKAAPKKKSAPATAAPSAPPQYTTVFGEALVEEARRDERIVGITAAMNSGTGLNILQRELPDRYYDVGIAEQHAVLFAAGLALGGMKPVAAIYSTFLQRAYDQIVHDVCLQRLNVVFAMDRAGLVGDDGPTHHGAFDIAYLRCLPNITLMAPRDEAVLVDMLHTATLFDEGAIALRYPRGEGEGVPVPSAPRPIDIGRGELLQEGDRVALLGYGFGVSVARRAAALLEEHDLSATVADARFAKPLDAELIATLAAEHELIVTIEDGVLQGGFGSAVAEHMLDHDLARDTRLLRVGLPDRFVTHGKPALLHTEVGLTPEAVVERVLDAVGSRSSVLLT